MSRIRIIARSMFYYVGGAGSATIPGLLVPPGATNYEEYWEWAFPNTPAPAMTTIDMETVFT